MKKLLLKRKICVITGSRAEYSLLLPLLEKIQGDTELTLQLVVTGAHLSAKFGKTVSDIENDGFEISARVDLHLDKDDTASVCNSMALGINGMSAVFTELMPDIIVVLGDRYEILAAVQAALFHLIPVAHIHGGEVTTGAFDDAIRHTITKMSHIHFASAEPYSNRIRQMGEDPDHVHMTGALAADNILNLSFMSREELSQSLDMSLNERIFLVTYHPVTLDPQESKFGLEAMFEALDAFPDASIIFTGVNADPGNIEIKNMIGDYSKQNSKRIGNFETLGLRRYLSAMNLADVVIGNSSSGIIEAPIVGTPTVNIGSRQKGRLRGLSIIDCMESTSDIKAAISKVLSPDFLKNLADEKSVYGDGDAASSMIKVLKTVNLDNITIKKFHNMEIVL